MVIQWNYGTHVKNGLKKSYLLVQQWRVLGSGWRWDRKIDSAVEDTDGQHHIWIICKDKNIWGSKPGTKKKTQSQTQKHGLALKCW